MILRSITFLPIVCAALIVAGCASSEKTEMSTSTPGTPAGKQSMKPPAVTTDPLSACMASISQNATPGQRALAELTCQRDFGKSDTRSVAVGAPGDTLQACLARIPSEASAGQRMIAEQSCRRDEEARKG